MERLSDDAALVRVVRGQPDAYETAALMTVLVTALTGAARRTGPATPPPARPSWQPFTGHRGGGWGRP